MLNFNYYFILLGVSDVIAKSSQITQDELVRQNQARRMRERQTTGPSGNSEPSGPSGNSLERTTVMPRDEPQSQIFMLLLFLIIFVRLSRCIQAGHF